MYCLLKWGLGGGVWGDYAGQAQSLQAEQTVGLT